MVGVRAGGFTGVLIVVVALLPAASVAQAPPRTDPSGDSPSGTVYDIPFEDAREDGAPREPKQPSDDGAGTSSPRSSTDSSIKTENGFGSSSAVPGATAPESSDEKDTGKKRDKKKSASKRAAQAVANSTAQPAVEATRAATSDGPSEFGTFLLLGVVVAAALGAGLVAVRRRRRGVGS